MSDRIGFGSESFGSFFGLQGLAWQLEEFILEGKRLMIPNSAKNFKWIEIQWARIPCQRVTLHKLKKCSVHNHLK